MFFSPIIVAVACTLYFIAEVARMRAGYRLTTGRYVGRILVGALAGLAIAFLGVVALTAIYDSPQGPLA